MNGDLGKEGDEVHAEARLVLDFWLREVTREQRFAKDADMDAEIERRFGTLRDHVLATGAAAWRDDPDATLAAIILLDQFSRNMHRGTAEAFAGDPLARDLAHLALARGWDAERTTEERQFLYMPLMHAEDPEAQAQCVSLFETLGDPEALAFARDHADVIARYGRFPSRNAALGRISTPDEQAYLSRPGAGW